MNQKICPGRPEMAEGEQKTRALAASGAEISNDLTAAGKPVFYGVSTGPGDPELMTLKAVCCIEKAEVLAVPRTMKKHTMALDIAAQAADIEGKEILYLDFSMSRDQEQRDREHRENAEKIVSCLQSGKTTAMLAIGDVSLYSTYGYVRGVVQEAGFPVETVAGVNSFSAAAAISGRMLTQPDQPLMIIPEQYDDVEEALRFPGTKVVMKPGRDSALWKEQLKNTGLLDDSAVVINCGLPDQACYAKAADAPEKTGYFTLVLVNSEEKAR